MRALRCMMAKFSRRNVPVSRNAGAYTVGCFLVFALLAASSCGGDSGFSVEVTLWGPGKVESKASQCLSSEPEKLCPVFETDGTTLALVATDTGAELFGGWLVIPNNKDEPFVQTSRTLSLSNKLAAGGPLQVVAFFGEAASVSGGFGSGSDGGAGGRGGGVLGGQGGGASSFGGRGAEGGGGQGGSRATGGSGGGGGGGIATGGASGMVPAASCGTQKTDAPYFFSNPDVQSLPLRVLPNDAQTSDAVCKCADGGARPFGQFFWFGDPENRRMTSKLYYCGGPFTSGRAPSGALWFVFGEMYDWAAVYSYSDDPSSRLPSKGARLSLTFSNTGNYSYYCDNAEGDSNPHGEIGATNLKVGTKLCGFEIVALTPAPRVRVATQSGALHEFNMIQVRGKPQLADLRP